ncbi:hypothetical protein KP05_03865, partial [Cobetia amphilecti]|uniref:hypothetical protein n=1 Tax=Cobetia amphilecti TaxID=1055104 RepID=UPI0005013435
ADDSPAAQRVQQSISQDVVVGTAQSAATQPSQLRETGMSVAAGRIQQSIKCPIASHGQVAHRGHCQPGIR